jgi:CRISPR-associated endonuclease Cas2
LKRFVVCYDVSDDRQRLKVMKTLKKMGFHSQLSFFEVEAHSEREILIRLEPLLKEVDRLAVGRISKRGRIKRIGTIIEGTEWVL